MPGIQREPFIIAVAGGTASGKSSVCKRIREELTHEEQRQVAFICQDSFYRDLNPEEGARASVGDFNFDHPDSLEHDLFYNTLLNLRQGKSVKIPTYDFTTNARVPNKFEVIGADRQIDVVIVEGILVFWDQKWRDLYNMKVFVSVDDDTRLERRIRRDLVERGRELHNILHQYRNFVKPSYEDFCLPTKKYADIIIPRGEDNIVAIDCIVKHIQDFLRTPRTSPARINGVGSRRSSYQTNGSASPGRDQKQSNRVKCTNGNHYIDINNESVTMAPVSPIAVRPH